MFAFSSSNKIYGAERSEKSLRTGTKRVIISPSKYYTPNPYIAYRAYNKLLSFFFIYDIYGVQSLGQSDIENVRIRFAETSVGYVE